MKQHIDALYEELYSLRADIMNDGEALFRTWLPGWPIIWLFAVTTYALCKSGFFPWGFPL